MTWEAWFTLGMIVLLMGSLMSNRVSADVAMLGVLTLLMIAGVLEPGEALSGFASKAVGMIAAIYVVAAGLSETGAVELIAQRVLGRPKSLAAAQTRMMIPVALMSAFMNTTAVVAMYIPTVGDWCKKLNLSPSKLYIPLSFAAIMGGTCTLIGTSSNITINGLYNNYLTAPENAALVSRFNLTTPEFWWVAVLGLPGAFCGMAFIVFGSRWLLPDRLGKRVDEIDPREYTVEMMVEVGGPIVGQTIEEAGLRHLPQLYLHEIERRGDILTAVGSETRLEADDRLVFAGVVDSVVDLRKIRGLVSATDQVKKVTVGRRQRRLVEAVVSNRSPLIGQTVRGSRFRTRYNAAIIAVHRNGERVGGKIGDIVMRVGDTLLMETHVGFVRTYRNSRDFFLVSQVEGAREVRHERAILSLCILTLLIVLLVMRPWDYLISAFLCALLMVATRCVTGAIARASVSLQVLIVIGAAIGVGVAMEKTGAAGEISNALLRVCDTIGMGPRGVLLVVFLLTSLFAQAVTNNGAAVLMFPIAIATATRLEVSPVPFIISLMVASACSFMTPIAYQTNLMVYGPGGYRFSDYMWIGVPLTLLMAAISTVIAPWWFPFHP